jgi:hypothetical protein
MGIPIGGKTIPLFVVSKNSSGTKKLPNNRQFFAYQIRKQGALRHVYKKRFATRPIEKVSLG